MARPKDLSVLPSTPIPDVILQQVMDCLYSRQDNRSVSAWNALDNAIKFARSYRPPPVKRQLTPAEARLQAENNRWKDPA